MIDISFDTIPEQVPNPPPWKVDYISDKDQEAPNYGGVLPVARTSGILRFGCPELEVRLAPPKLAAALLDRIGVWEVFERKKLEIGDQLRLDIDPETVYTVVPLITAAGIPMLRLAWHRDPAPSKCELLEAIKRFNTILTR